MESERGMEIKHSIPDAYSHFYGFREWWDQYPILKIAYAAANDHVLKIDNNRHITLRRQFIRDAFKKYQYGWSIDDILENAELDEIVNPTDLLEAINEWGSDNCLDDDDHDDDTDDSQGPTICCIYIGALKELFAVQQRLQKDHLCYLMTEPISGHDSFDEAMKHIDPVLELVDITVRMECERLSMAEKLSGDEHHEQL